MPRNALKTLVLIPALALAACADEPFEPIVDGHVSAAYQSDLAACRNVAQQAKITNRETTAGAVIGGLIGAVDSDDGDELEGAIIGAALGGALGRAGENEAVEERRKVILVNCMRGRGHNVVG